MLVSVQYKALPGQANELITQLRDARFARRRTGATRWRAWQDAEDSDRILEQFVVASWIDHLRQRERMTRRDQNRFDRIRALTDSGTPTTATHWLTARTQPQPRRPQSQPMSQSQPGDNSADPAAHSG